MTVVATVDNAVQGSNLVITLNNGQSITIYAEGTDLGDGTTADGLSGSVSFAVTESVSLSVFEVSSNTFEDLDLSDTADITFVFDDAPVAINPEEVIIVNSGGSVTGALDIDNQVEDNFGNDVQGSSITFNYQDGQDSGFTSSGLPVYLYQSAGVMYGTTTLLVSGQSYDPSNDSNQVFSVSLAVTNGNDTFTFNLDQPLDLGGYETGVSSFSGGNSDWQIFLNTSEGSDQLFTAYEIADGDRQEVSFNTSGNQAGAANNQVNSDQGIRIEFVKNGAYDPGTNGKNGTPESYSFVGYELVNGAVGVINLADNKTSSIKVSTLDVSGDQSSSSSTIDPISRIIIQGVVYDRPSGLDAENAQPILSSDGFVEWGADGTVTILNVSGNSDGEVRIETFTLDGFGAIEYANVGGDPFGLAGVGTLVETSVDVGLSFGLVMTDGDGDTLDIANAINVTVQAQAQPAGNEISFSSDTFFATSGADTFEWSLADQNPEGDVIKNFDATEDVIDLGDLLTGYDPADPNNDLTNFIQVAYDSGTGDTTIQVSSNGDGTINQVIKVEGANLFDIDGNGDEVSMTTLLQQLRTGAIIDPDSGG